MSRFTRHLFAVAAVVVLGQLALVSFPATTSDRAACDAVQRWASRYAHARPTLDDLVRVDPARRIAIFNAIGPDARADLWRTQLTRAAGHAGLTIERRHLLREGSHLATPALYSGDLAAKRAFDAFWQRADRHFRSAEDRRIWFELGGNMPTAEPSVLALRRWLPAFVAAAQSSPRCRCSVAAFNECPYPLICLVGPCQPLVFGCGRAGSERCDGLCSP